MMPRDILAETLRRFESGEYEWIQRAYTEGPGRYCLAGGIDATVRSRPPQRRITGIYEIVCAAIAAEHGDTGCSVQYFNDWIARDFADVRTVLKRAIDKC